MLNRRTTHLEIPGLNYFQASPQTPPGAVAEITNEERKIKVAEPIADPIICDLQLDGTTRRCSVVLPGKQRVTSWLRHIDAVHQSLPSGTVTTVNTLGRFFSTSTGNKRKRPTTTTETEMNSSTENTEDSNSQIRLGRPNLKRKSIGCSPEKPAGEIVAPDPASLSFRNDLHELIMSISTRKTLQNETPSPPVPSPLTDHPDSPDLRAPLPPSTHQGVGISREPPTTPPPPPPPPPPSMSHTPVSSIHSPHPSSRYEIATLLKPIQHPRPMSRDSLTTTSNASRHSSENPQSSVVKLETPLTESSVLDDLPEPLRQVYVQETSIKTRLNLLKSMLDILPTLVQQEEAKWKEEKNRIEAEKARQAAEDERLLAEKLSELERVRKEIEELQRRQTLRDQGDSIPSQVPTMLLDGQHLDQQTRVESSPIRSSVGLSEESCPLQASLGPSSTDAMVEKPLNSAKEIDRRTNQSDSQEVARQSASVFSNVSAKAAQEMSQNILQQLTVTSPGKATDPRPRPKLEPADLQKENPLQPIVNASLPAAVQNDKPQSSSSIAKRFQESTSASTDHPSKKVKIEPTGQPLAYYCTSKPASVLLTHDDPNWSRFCICLGANGHIDLLDSIRHRPVPDVLVRAERYTTGSAINGTWISPGSVALVDKDCRFGNAQVTVVDYHDPELTQKPRVTRLRAAPHYPDVKITSIVRLWEHKLGIRKFITADRQGMFILWDVDPEATAQVSDLPDYHLANPITAMAYIDSRQWLLTASRRHLQITDMRNPKYKGGVGSTRTDDNISAISPNIHDANLTMLGLRHHHNALSLVDYRLDSGSKVVKGFTIDDSVKYAMVPWNLSGAWFPNNSNYFALGGGGEGKVYIWDIRGKRSPVKKYESGLKGSILNVRFSEGQMLLMSEERLAWVNLSDV